MAIVGAALADVSHILTDTTTYPPRPYQFSYEAGRAPGHTDREIIFAYLCCCVRQFSIFFLGSHSEVGDGAGTGKYLLYGYSRVISNKSHSAHMYLNIASFVLK